jgi:hypothetical protein
MIPTPNNHPELIRFETAIGLAFVMAALVVVWGIFL